MIKIENIVLASPEQMEFIIEGMRNPMNSWEKSDSGKCGWDNPIGCANCSDQQFCDETMDEKYHLGINDLGLMQRLFNAGTEHRKYMRMMPVYMRITAPLYWWKEFDTYKIGTVANSCSTMHKIADKEFTIDDFSYEHLISDEDTHTNYFCVLDFVVDSLNRARVKYLETKDKDYWWQMIQLLPSSYNQRRTVQLNYEVLLNIYHARKNHKLDCWRTFCEFIETLPYFKEICLGGESDG